MYRQEKKKRSMRKQLTGFIYILIICFALVWIASIASLVTQNNRHLAMWERQMNVSAFFQQLNRTQEDLKSIMLFSDEDSYQLIFEQSAGEFEKTAKQIADDYDARIIYELNRMARTYLEYARQSAELRSIDVIESRKIYEQAVYICDLIQEQFNDVYDEIDSIVQREAGQYRAEQWLMTVTVAVVILAVIAASLYYTKKFARLLVQPILVLADAARKVGDGDRVPVEILPDAGVEMDVLASCFNDMVTQIEQQMQELKEKGELEYQLLQAQINPHFLFNTLNMIQQLAFIGQTAQTMQAVELLSKMLRYGLTDKKYATAAQETENAGNYMRIQQMRYEERICFQEHIQEETGPLVMPLMILQPLVENSVIHGMNRNVPKLLVGVEVVIRNGRVQIRVYDNGKGMTEDVISSLQDNKSGSAQSIGLRNIRRRLSIFFMDDIVMEIKSQPYVYTEVVIEVPAVQEEMYANGFDDRGRGNRTKSF